MMAGNPSWWSMNNYTNEPNPPSSSSSSQATVFGSVDSSPFSADTAYVLDHFPVRSWSQLLLGGGGDQAKKLENWEDQILNPFTDLKQELAQSTSGFSVPWHLPASSPSSFGSSVLEFSGERAVAADGGPKSRKHPKNGDRSPEKCSSTSFKKARVQQSSVQPALKVRKEKLGDRITALHQLVSPYGKTDTASVLTEAIGHIILLQSQIQVLSSPYLRNQNSVQETSCLLTDEGCQESRGGQGKDLRSKGLCLVPVSCTQHVRYDNGADYWAPASLGGGGF